MLVKNCYLKNKAINSAIGIIKFNAEGIAQIEDENYASKLIELANFSEIKDLSLKTTEMSVDASKKEDSIKPSDDEELIAKRQELNSLGVMQLKKLAKEQKINLGTASKKQDIINIIMNN